MRLSQSCKLVENISSIKRKNGFKALSQEPSWLLERHKENQHLGLQWAKTKVISCNIKNSRAPDFIGSGRLYWKVISRVMDTLNAFKQKNDMIWFIFYKCWYECKVESWFWELWDKQWFQPNMSSVIFLRIEWVHHQFTGELTQQNSHEQSSSPSGLTLWPWRVADATPIRRRGLGQPGPLNGIRSRGPWKPMGGT